MRIINAMLACVATIGLGGVSVAQESEEPSRYAPQGKDCQVAPVAQDVVANTIQELQVLLATPRVPAEFERGIDDPLSADQISEADLPTGMPADAGMVLAITGIEQEYAACFNAGEFQRAAALMTGEGLLAVVSLAIAFEGDLESATPVPPPEGYRIPSVSVYDVRLLPDGRAGAVIEWGPERSFHVYEQVDDHWRIADEIRIYD